MIKIDIPMLGKSQEQFTHLAGNNMIITNSYEDDEAGCLLSSQLQSEHGLDIERLKRNKKIIDQEILVLNRGQLCNDNGDSLADKLSKSPIGSQSKE